MSYQFHLMKKLSQKKASSKGRPRRYPENTFGGSRFRSYNPSEQRPIFAQKALHLVLRSDQATGRFSMKTKSLEGKVWAIIEKHGKKNNVKIYEYANAGNHLHLLVRVKRRDQYCRFIRSITGLIARAVKGCERGVPLNGRFWVGRPFTRVVSFSGGDFKKVKLYLARNRLEALGFLRYVPRRRAGGSEWSRFWSFYACVP